jgi:DNA mismatch repair protein MutS
LAAIHFDAKKNGVAFLDISTGEFMLAEGSIEYIDKLIQGFNPSEILFQKNKKHLFEERFGHGYYTFKLEDWIFSEDFGRETLTKHFQTKNLKGFGVEELTHGIIAAGAILHYIADAQHDKLGHISRINRIEEDKYVWLDRFTIRSLELIDSPNDYRSTLINVLDSTVTPMGGRTMKRWVVLPLKDLALIEKRQAAVEGIYNENELRFELTQRLGNIGDLERLISKVAVAKINPKEVMQLRRTLSEIEPIRKLIQTSGNKELHQFGAQLENCDGAIQLIEKMLDEDPANQLGKGRVIASGVNEELDELRNLSDSGKNYLEELQVRESARTEISSLKVAFNNVFGYYIEVRNTHKDKVPEDWIRKQTLVNAERYITEELKEYEHKILGAEEKIQRIESQLYQELIYKLSDYIQPIQQNARLIGQLDCLTSFAETARRHQYTKPEVNEGFAISIKNGRHPVIERQMKPGEEFVPNDIYLDNETCQIMMITGPNMSGKSAILRQTALIALMAQMGSFVPSESASIGLIDRVFTRVGASDNIASGESTFMVEMNETSNILNNLSNRSLILLDEIGRGTSTYDGISIAWAIAEYLHQHPTSRSKTLFATHYHELNEMSGKFERIKNFNVAVRETGTKILFLRKLVEGGSEHSFGIHVAKLAGMPATVVQRATKMLNDLEASRKTSDKESFKHIAQQPDMQLSFFQLDDPILENVREELQNLDIDTLTPVEALMKLNEIKKMTVSVKQ